METLKEREERILRNTIRDLQAIKTRYFRPVIARFEGLVTHHGTCEIYRAIDVYGFAACTCGLLHDLKSLEGCLAEKIYPNYYKDYKRQENPNGKEMTQEELDEATKELEKAFNTKFVPQSPEELESQDRQEWDIIEKVFGESYVKHTKSNKNH